MDLTINLIWIGGGSLGWLEKFVVYSWWAVGCDVNLYTHKPSSETPHDHVSLGLNPVVARIHDLPTIMKQDTDKSLGSRTRAALTSWYNQALPGGKDGWRVPTFNMVDLSKSYIGMHKVGVVFDMKVGPSRHIQHYVETGVFHNHFVSYKRAKVVENQCMGTMMYSNSTREKYGMGFEEALFNQGPQHGELNPLSMATSITSAWFPIATNAHKKALGLKTQFGINGAVSGLRSEWFDIGRGGKVRHEQEGIMGAVFVGIDGDYYGPIRIFKNEWDQTNKPNNQEPTTTEQRKNEVNRGFKDLLPLAKRYDRDGELMKFMLSPTISNALGLKRF